MDPLSIAAVGWLMSALVSKAVTALLEAWAKRIGYGNEFKTLKDQLLQLGALLTSTRSLRTNNKFLEELVQNLQQLAYRAENLLDELDYYRLEDEIQQIGTQVKRNYSNKSSVASSSSSFQLTSRSVLSTLKGMSCCSARDALISLPETFSTRINLSRRMNELAEELQKSEEKVRYALQTESLVIITHNTEISQTEATNLPQTSSFQTVTREVVGRNQERDQLLNLLKYEETAIVGKVLVLSIVGCGGVGKTALAGLVFNDPNIEPFFHVKSWICVSTRFDIVRLTREMIESACGKRCDLNNLNALQKELKEELKCKRFLLVLDDMWEAENKMQWDLMIALLNNCNVERGIILVTTRNQSVVNMVDASYNINLKGLDDNAFLKLFSTCIFNDPNFGGNWKLRKIGKEIANKLKGNPLAAKTVSALLKKKIDERYWMEIRDNEEWKSQRDPNDIMPALRLSYEHMPFHLQRCFSSCAMLPEDHTFKCEELVYLWMAQGFLDVRSEAKRMEDIGSAYFDDLFNRGFFQTKQSTFGDKVHYTFHDLIHDLACMVAFKECLTINGLESRQIPPTIRHLSIFRWNEEAITSALTCLKGENLSTIFNWNELRLGSFQRISFLLNETKFLRAVSLNLCSRVQPHDFKFQNFVSLRYLRLIISEFNSYNTLPREICRLYHLEVFEINAYLKELPNNFVDLVSLRHFIVRGQLHSKICGVGKLTSLQELNHFDAQQKLGFEIEQLGSLKEIGGSLHIWNLDNVKSMTEARNARLAEKEKLDALYLKWNHGEQENECVLEGLQPNTNLKFLSIVGYGGVTSPTWLEPSLIFLESLTLKGCKSWEMLPPIGELGFLKHLNLYGLATREIGPQCYGTRQSLKFASLEELNIVEMADLEKWVWDDQPQQLLCLKKLKKLTIRHCTKLLNLPLYGCATYAVLERFPSLEILIIDDCPLICQLPPLPYSSVLSFISIKRTGIIKLMHYMQKQQQLSLILNQSSSHKVVQVLDFHELRSLRSLEISNISSLELLDLLSFVALEELYITGCQSLNSLTFGEHLISLRRLTIISCKTLSSMKGLKSWVNLESLYFRECPGIIAAWDSASKEIEKTEPEFSMSLTTINGDSLALLTLSISKQLTSLQYFDLEVFTFTEEQEVSLQLLTSIHLVDIMGCENLQSFPFELFPSLETLRISFPRIQSLPTNNHSEITEECLKLGNIKEVHIFEFPIQVLLVLTSKKMMCKHVSAVDWRRWRTCTIIN